MANTSQVAENQTSKRDAFMEKYKGLHPDLQADNEDAVFGSLGEDFDNYDNQIAELQKYKNDQDAFLKSIASNKDNARYIEGMLNGEDILATAIGIHGYDGLMEYLQNEEAREKYKEADAKHKAELAKSAELDKEAEANAEQTEKDIDNAIKEGRFTEKDYEVALDELFNIADGLELNVVKPEWIEMILAAKNHDADVDAAREQGRKDGKNEGIEANINKKRNVKAAQQQGQGMPVNMGGRTGQSNKRGGNLAELLMG